MKIRPAQITDVSKIAELSSQLGYPVSTAEVETRLRRMLPKADHLILVACQMDDVVLGWIHAFLTYRVESAPFAELGGFVVHEDYRGQGIGKQLSAAVEDWCISHNIEKLRVRTRADRADAHGFYEAAGFQRTKTQFIFDKLLTKQQMSK